jgi:hypothetical protein
LESWCWRFWAIWRATWGVWQRAAGPARLPRASSCLQAHLLIAPDEHSEDWGRAQCGAQAGSRGVCPRKSRPFPPHFSPTPRAPVSQAAAVARTCPHKQDWCRQCGGCFRRRCCVCAGPALPPVRTYRKRARRAPVLPPTAPTAGALAAAPAAGTAPVELGLPWSQPLGVSRTRGPTVSPTRARRVRAQGQACRIVTVVAVRYPGSQRVTLRPTAPPPAVTQGRSRLQVVRRQQRRQRQQLRPPN